MKYTFMCYIIGSVFFSCKKDPIETTGVASLLLVNAIQDGKTVKLNSNQRDSSLNYNSKVFGLIPTTNKVYLYPIGDSLNAYFNGRLPLENGGIYSLYLSGSTSTPDTLLIKETLPPYYTDSTVGIRLVNLCTGSASLYLTIASDSTVNLFSTISYRKITGFTKRALPRVVPTASVTFQLRDANKKLVASYILPASANATYLNISIAASRNRNLTLVAKGTIGATGINAPGLYPVANY